MEAFFESGVGLAVFAGVGAVGLLIKLFADIKINRLVRQSKNMGETKDRQLKLWKSRFENTYRMNHGMNNVLVFIKRNFRQYRICGIPIQSFDRINVTLAGLIAIAALGAAAFTVWSGMRADIAVIYCLTGAFCAGVMLIWERICCTSEKKEYIVANIQDFYENTLIRKLELGNELRNSDKNAKATEKHTAKKFAPIEEKVFNQEKDKPCKELPRRVTSEKIVPDALDETRRSGRDTRSERYTADIFDEAIRSGREVRAEKRAADDIESIRRRKAAVSSEKERDIPESFEEARKRRESEKMRKDVEYLKQSLDRIAAGMEPEYVHPTRKLTESEEKLIEEFIKEYIN